MHSPSALWSNTDLHGLRTAVSSLPYSFDILIQFNYVDKKLPLGSLALGIGNRYHTFKHRYSLSLVSKIAASPFSNLYYRMKMVSVNTFKACSI